MLIIENIRLALLGLKSNKMRALLTMLGIIIGIGSVIGIMTLGDAVTNTVANNMESMGGNNITVTVEEREAEEDEQATFKIEEDEEKEPEAKDLFTTEMVNKLCQEYPDEIKAISATESLGSSEISLKNIKSDITVTGVSAGYFAANETKIEAGSLFNAREFEEGGRVALIDKQVVDDLYAGDMSKAVGSSVNIAINEKYYDFVISGVYTQEDKTGMSSMAAMFGMGGGTKFFIPLKTARSISRSTGYSTFTVVVNQGVEPDTFAAELNRYLENVYRNNRTFHAKAESYTAIVDMFSSMMNTVTTAIALIGAISLLVGGIGVMNIMLVSVTERTREIGTRKALGAPNSSIRLQFITESIVICIIGGIIGIIVGCTLGYLGARYLGVDTTPSIRSIIISIAFSTAIGVFFGYYPANKAAKLNPIDALRYE